MKWDPKLSTNENLARNGLRKEKVQSGFASWYDLYRGDKRVATRLRTVDNVNEYLKGER